MAISYNVGVLLAIAIPLGVVCLAALFALTFFGVKFFSTTQRINDVLMRKTEDIETGNLHTVQQPGVANNNRAPSGDARNSVPPTESFRLSGKPPRLSLNLHGDGTTSNQPPGSRNNNRSRASRVGGENITDNTDDVIARAAAEVAAGNVDTGVLGGSSTRRQKSKKEHESTRPKSSGQHSQRQAQSSEHRNSSGATSQIPLSELSPIQLPRLAHKESMTTPNKQKNTPPTDHLSPLPLNINSYGIDFTALDAIDALPNLHELDFHNSPDMSLDMEAFGLESREKRFSVNRSSKRASRETARSQRTFDQTPPSAPSPAVPGPSTVTRGTRQSQHSSPFLEPPRFSAGLFPEADLGRGQRSPPTSLQPGIVLQDSRKVTPSHRHQSTISSVAASVLGDNTSVPTSPVHSQIMVPEPARLRSMNFQSSNRDRIGELGPLKALQEVSARQEVSKNPVKRSSAKSEFARPSKERENAPAGSGARAAVKSDPGPIEEPVGSPEIVTRTVPPEPLRVPSPPVPELETELEPIEEQSEPLESHVSEAPELVQSESFSSNRDSVIERPFGLPPTPLNLDSVPPLRTEPVHVSEIEPAAEPPTPIHDIEPAISISGSERDSVVDTAWKRASDGNSTSNGDKRSSVHSASPVIHSATDPIPYIPTFPAIRPLSHARSQSQEVSSTEALRIPKPLRADRGTPPEVPPPRGTPPADRSSTEGASIKQKVVPVSENRLSTDTVERKEGETYGSLRGPQRRSANAPERGDIAETAWTTRSSASASSRSSSLSYQSKFPPRPLTPPSRLRHRTSTTSSYQSYKTAHQSITADTKPNSIRSTHSADHANAKPDSPVEPVPIGRTLTVPSARPGASSSSRPIAPPLPTDLQRLSPGKKHLTSGSKKQQHKRHGRSAEVNKPLPQTPSGKPLEPPPAMKPPQPPNTPPSNSPEYVKLLERIPTKIVPSEQNKETPDSNFTGLDVEDGVIANLMGTSYRVVFPYTHQLGDELDLQLGDTVRVYQVFDDGWCFGQKDASAGKIIQGICPKSCLGLMS